MGPAPQPGSAVSPGGRPLADPADEPDYRAALARLRDFYETLTPESLAGIGGCYAEHAWFKDPFNEVTGVAAIAAIFRAMFTQVDAPRFVVREAILEGSRACLVWDFEFRFRRRGATSTDCIRGASWVEFDREGRVCRHRDYWDAAEELYQKLPVIGALMRWLRRRLAH
jgi:steroid delta-isomerase